MRRCFSARASGLGRSVPACGERFAGMRGFEAVEAGEGVGPGEIGGEGLGGGVRITTIDTVRLKGTNPFDVIFDALA